MGVYRWTTIGVIKGDTRSLDYSSYRGFYKGRGPFGACLISGGIYMNLRTLIHIASFQSLLQLSRFVATVHPCSRTEDCGAS